ncbi:Lrp/AsnC family transcriptional regulator [Neoroseomonas lacus]|uniref:Uncharacterized protein n=1 Tax=Neoroseomonas lacus TaxID=287609 RepID=A0A917KQ71_9PROT|nr:Lrp/AsnC family transcriptional regulator [Neoroseomonas lacus]GGJ22659.1 hypothetical protein GCM10011320_32360 [Neoroseomonas lacus]
MSIEHINRDRFRKVWNLAKESPSAGERDAAMARAEAMLASAGLSMADAPCILAETEPAHPRDIFDGFDDWMEAKQPGYKAEAAAARAEKACGREEFRQTVIRKYGSEESAKAPTARERALDSAAAPFVCREMKTYSNGTFPNWTLDGWDPFGLSKGEMPAHVRAALETALPWPKTLAEAADELAWWEHRDREIGAAWGDVRGDSYLSLACYARRNMIDDALAYDIPAADIRDLIHRQRHGMDRDWHDEKINAAVLADLERFAAQGNQSEQPEAGGQRVSETVQFGQTATQRREAVVVMLSDPDTAALPNRELARRAGVSPSTVSNIRRRLAKERQGELFGAAA